MKILIKYRLFLYMLAATGATVICMFLIMQWSIDRGFLAYVNTMEIERLERLAESVERAYAQEGSWDFLNSNPESWRRLVASSRSGDLSEPERRGWRGRPDNRAPAFADQSGLRLPPRFPHRFESRVLLLDAQHRRLVGSPQRPERPPTLKKIIYEGKVVGYLALFPRQRLTETHQMVFVQQQKLAMGLVAAMLFLVSAALALPLANRLVRPIKRLAASMHRLASGEFATRVEVGAEDELGQLSRDFNTLALTLEKNEEARRRWVADISHELRTPLAVLRGEIEALQDGVRATGPESLRSLHGEVMHLSRLVDDLYQLSLVDIGALSYKKIDLELREELEDAVDGFRHEFAQKGIRLTADLGDAPCPVFGDPGRLQQLFHNLFENSLRYTDPGGELALSLERQGGRARLEFADSAPGVAPEELERIFDRLYRVEASRNRARGGAGLGLAICKSIVEAHEGSMGAQASPLGGIMITIELPLAGKHSGR